MMNKECSFVTAQSTSVSSYGVHMHYMTVDINEPADEATASYFSLQWPWQWCWMVQVQVSDFTIQVRVIVMFVCDHIIYPLDRATDS